MQVALSIILIVKRCEIEMGGQGLLLLIGLKVLIMMILQQKLLFKVLKAFYVDGIIAFDKGDQAAKH